MKLDADEVETAPRQRQAKAQPRPATHLFSSTAWLKGNPGGDIKQAIARAKEFGYEVTK